MKRNNILRPTPTALLNPRLDPIFKILFTSHCKESKIALQEFLSAILETPVSHVRLLPNTLSGESKDDKMPQFDLTCKIGNNEYANIEIQGNSNYKFFDNRAEYHAAHLLNHYVPKGMQWKEIPFAYQISVLDFIYDNSNSDGINHYYMQTDSGNTLANKLNVVFIELPKFKKYVNMKVKEMNSVQRWALFFLYGDSLEHLDLIEQLAKEEFGIMWALNLLQRISRNDRLWMMQNHFWDHISDMRSMKADAREDGLEEGRAEGRAEGIKEGIKQSKMEIAQKLYKNGVPADIIYSSTGITLEEILKN